MRKSFAQDFAALEAALRRQRRQRVVVMTPEQLVVELRLTPRSVKQIERRFGVSFRWHAATYAALRRHKLMPRKRMLWETWLQQYQRAKANQM